MFKHQVAGIHKCLGDFAAALDQLTRPEKPVFASDTWKLEDCEMARNCDIIYLTLNMYMNQVESLLKQEDFKDSNGSVKNLFAEMTMTSLRYYRVHTLLSWPQVFIVTSSPTGHIHSSLECHSCNRGEKSTDLVLFPPGSARLENDLVEKFGELCCSICYKSAPVAKVSS